jgi:enamine deaminase RidA (YjgF/YER057c/UK114 family)
MNRTDVNPWSWSVNFGFDQAELLEGHTRQLVCSGQTAVDADGNPQHPGDMAGQLNLALDNLETVLAQAGMTVTNLIRLNIYTTNVDALLAYLSILSERLDGARYASTLLGVARLAVPELLVELEATAVG